MAEKIIVGKFIFLFLIVLSWAYVGVINKTREDVLELVYCVKALFS